MHWADLNMPRARSRLDWGICECSATLATPQFWIIIWMIWHDLHDAVNTCPPPSIVLPQPN